MIARVGLSRRLNFIILSINILILLVVAVLASLSSDAALRDQAIDRFRAKNDEAASQINREVQAVIQQAETLATGLESLDIDDAAAVRQSFTAFLDANDAPLIERINLIRPDGSAGTLALSRQRGEFSYRWRLYTRENNLPQSTLLDEIQARGERRWIRQESAFFDQMNRPAISLAVPYEVASGAGVLWIDILPQTLTTQISRALNNEGLLTDTENGYALLLDSSNEPLTTHNLPLDFANPATAIQTVQQRINTSTDSFAGMTRAGDPFYDDATALFNTEGIEGTEWRFISSLPVAELPTLPTGIFIPVFVVALMGVAALTLATNRFIQQQVVKPLVDLGRSASEIGEGNMRFIVFHQDKRDEIGRLANAMEQMRVRLRESYDELQEWSRMLENRVDERTQQLAETQQRAEDNAEQLRAVYDESLKVVNEARLQPVLDAFIERILTLLDATYCAVWLLTTDGERLQLLATNDSRRRKSKGAIVIHRSEGIAGAAVRFQEPLRIDNYRDFEHRVLLDDFYEEVSLPFTRGMSVPLTFAGQPIGAAIAGRPDGADPFTISEQRQLTLFANLVAPSVRNAQLFVQLNQAVEEAERANQVKTRFLASVTHELRTPLNLIINNMDFMRIGTFGEVNKEQVRRLNQTVRGAEHLLYLINDLLDVSKIEAGEMKLHAVNTQVYTMLEDATDNAHAMLATDSTKKNKVNFRAEIEDDLPAIPMDARRIRQVLTNLISNAIKFTEEGSVTLKVFAADNGIHFSVHDTGMGIPDNEREKLFRAFERTSAAESSNIEGTGLGLPISRYLVQQHGGDLIVISTVGEGSTFAFTLPYETPDELAPTKDMTDTQQITAVLSSD